MTMFIKARNLTSVTFAVKPILTKRTYKFMLPQFMKEREIINVVFVITATFQEKALKSTQKQFMKGKNINVSNVMLQ